MATKRHQSHKLGDRVDVVRDKSHPDILPAACAAFAASF